MEHYYFTQHNGIKDGPFNFAQLKEQTIFATDILWRSDLETWKKSTEFEELLPLIINEPPPTPNELRRRLINHKFKRAIPKTFFYYVGFSVIVAIISFAVAQSSWESFLRESNGNNLRSADSYSYAELAPYKRYKSFLPGSNNETVYGINQNVIFRCYRAFFSTVYLTGDEQGSDETLFYDMLISSLATNFLFALLIFVISYGIQRTTDDDKIVQI